MRLLQLLVGMNQTEAVEFVQQHGFQPFVIEDGIQKPEQATPKYIYLMIENGIVTSASMN